MTVDAVLVLVAGVAMLALGTGYALGWRRRGVEVKAPESECARLAVELEKRRAELKASVERVESTVEQLALVEGRATRSETQIEQLRDLVKVHVARRREFDEWAQPIRASLGDGIGQVMQKLKDELARQEFSMRRQERIVAEAQDQYRGKRDELEQMRRELTLKNYHIAALNERFIRIEERMQDLATQVAGMAGVPPAAGHAAVDSSAAGADAFGVRLAGPLVSPETERFSLEGNGGKDWMSVLDDWHRQLHERFDRLEQLQARMRGAAARPSESTAPDAERSGGGNAA
jgi:hypothetical protein